MDHDFLTICKKKQVSQSEDALDKKHGLATNPA